MRTLVKIVAIGLVVTVAACAKRIEFPVSSSVPAAMAKAKVTQDDNGNNEILFEVSHLAPPSNLMPPRSVYIVWLQRADDFTVNLGALRLDKNLSGELRTLTPYSEFRLLVTAEDSVEVRVPRGQVVLATEMLKAQ